MVLTEVHISDEVDTWLWLSAMLWLSNCGVCTYSAPSPGGILDKSGNFCIHQLKSMEILPLWKIFIKEIGP